MSESISRLFDPIVVLPLSVVLIISLFGGFAANELIRFLSFFFLGILIPIVAFRIVLARVYKVAWDIPRRRDRVVPMMLLATYLGIGYALVRVFGNEFVAGLFLTLLVWFVGFMVITFWYKISGHVAADTIAILLLVRFLGIAWWPLVLIIPLVAWARVSGRHHTVGQVISGFLYSLLVFLL